MSHKDSAIGSFFSSAPGRLGALGVARTLWPLDPAEQEKIARRENVELAHEGEIVHLPR